MSISDGEQAIIDVIRELKDSFDDAETRRASERAADEARRETETSGTGGAGGGRSSISIDLDNGISGLNQAGANLGENITRGFDIGNSELSKTFAQFGSGAKQLGKSLFKDLDKSLTKGIGDALGDANFQLTDILSMSSAELAMNMSDMIDGAITGLKSFGVEAITEVMNAVDKMLEHLYKSIFITFISGLKELALDVYNFERGLERTLGITEQFSRTATESFDNVRKFLGKEGLEQVNKSYSALFKTFTDFTFATEIQKQRLTEVGAVLDTLGYSAENFAKSTQLLTKALGLTEDSAAQVQMNLTAMAMDIGVTVEQMSSDFVGASNTVAKLGSQGDVAFRRLAIAAKVTGIEVGRLISLTEKFDTFDGAAEQAGKLNAALGGNFVNAMDLMTATDPVERFNMIRDAIKNAGLTFDTMSYYQKNFYKEALGLNDVGELANMLSGNMNALNSQLGKTSAEYEEMAKRAARTQKIQDLLNTIFHNFLEIIEPAIDYVKGLADSFTEDMIPNIQTAKKMLTGFIAITGGLATTFATLGAVIAIALTPFTGGLSAGMAAGLSAIAASLGLATTGMTGFGLATIIGSSSAEALGIIFDALKDAFSEIISKFSLSTKLAYLFGDSVSSNATSIANFIAGAIEFFLPFFKVLARAIDIMIFLGSIVGGIIAAFAGFAFAVAQVFNPFAYLAAGMLAFGHVLDYIEDTLGPVVEKFVEIVTIATATGAAIGGLATLWSGPFSAAGAALGGVIGMITGVFMALFDLMFNTPFNPPSAFQGLIQLVEIFTSFGSAIFGLEGPLKFITGLFDTMFTAIFSSFGILKDAFNLLLELAKTDLTAINETFDSVSTAADSLNKISLAKMAMLTAGSTANALAQTVESASRVITAETGNNDKPIQINLTIEMDGEKFAKKVINITDREISTRRRIG